MTESRPSPAWLPFVVGSVAACLYILTLQARLFGDGIFFRAKLMESDGSLIYNHILYLPLAKLLQVAISLVHEIGAEQALKLLAALAGGAGVAMTYAVARECLESTSRALACAALLAGLQGYWFHSTACELHSLHAACSTVLLMGLFRVVNRRDLGSLRSCVFIAIGAALVPASHTSGIGIGLPLVYAFFKAGPARRRFLVSVGCGIAVFAAIYGSILVLRPGVLTYAALHSEKYAALLHNPGDLPRLLRVGLSEFGFYSIPAITLVPAGLRVLARTTPANAWLCLTWLLAWPLLAWPIDDRAIGSYYVPTFPVQALLAIVALHGLCQTWPRTLLVLVVSLVPAWVLLLPVWFSLDPVRVEQLAAFALLGSAALLCAMASADIDRPKGIWMFPVLTLALSATHIIAEKDLDPQRDRVRAVHEFLQAAEPEHSDRALVIFLATDMSDHNHWLHFLPGAKGNPDRAFNPVEMVIRPEIVSKWLLREWRRRVHKALTEGRSIWLAGSPEEIDTWVAPHPEFDAFLDGLRQTFRFHVPEGAPPDLMRLLPRR